MFSRNYFASRQFAPRYFEGHVSEEEVIAAGRRIWNENEAMPNVTAGGVSSARIQTGGIAQGRIKVGN